MSANLFYRMVLDRHGKGHTWLSGADRLQKLCVQESATCVCVCVECARKDSIIQRLTTFETSAEIWSWTRMRVAKLLRTDPRYIPNQRLKLSEFSVMVSAECNVVMWHRNKWNTTSSPAGLRWRFKTIWTLRTARWKTCKMAKTDGDLWELTECEYADLVIWQEIQIETRGNLWTSTCLGQLEKSLKKTSNICKRQWGLINKVFQKKSKYSDWPRDGSSGFDPWQG
jgi:hypothetical protein